MVDDDKLDEKPKEDAKPAPAFDAEALGKTISGQVASQVAEALRLAKPDEPTKAEPETQDALAQVLEPYVQRGTAKATLIAQMAADKADFYTASDPDELALRLEYKDEVEKRALALASAGRALPREDIFKHLKGEKEEEFFEKRSKRKARKEREAVDAADHGGDGVPRVRGGDAPSFVTSDAAYELQGKGKLDEWMGDKSF